MTQKREVYVVDDDSGMRELLCFLLEAQGMSAHAYGSAREFLAAGGAEKSGCVVADVRMPDMTGLELQQELLRRGSQLTVIIVTGHADVPMAVKAMRAGAADFLEKPFADDILLNTVQRALAELPAAQQSAQKAKLSEATAARLDRLTQRERQVVDHLVLGRPHKVIAHALGISPRTVEVHRARIMQKLEAGNLADLVRMMLNR